VSTAPLWPDSRGTGSPIAPGAIPGRPSCRTVGGLVLVVGPSSRVWRRRLGAAAWAAFEDLALVALPDATGWVAPVGVRDVAAGIGVNKDSAARAVSALRAAGLVTLTRVPDRHGRRRSGYRLNPPDGIVLHDCPNIPDSEGQEYSDWMVALVCPGIPDNAISAVPVTAIDARAKPITHPTAYPDDTSPALHPAALRSHSPSSNAHTPQAPPTAAPSSATDHPSPKSISDLTRTSADTSAPGGALLVSPAGGVSFP
jgi:hypothetical protein